VIRVTLSFNEIKDRSIKFSSRWKDCCSEHAEAKSFWDDFFMYSALIESELPLLKNLSEKMVPKLAI
jgi:hypothetical protein